MVVNPDHDNGYRDTSMLRAISILKLSPVPDLLKRASQIPTIDSLQRMGQCGITWNIVDYLWD